MEKNELKFLICFDKYVERVCIKMSIIFFGDSITEGSNCDCSFTDYLPHELEVENFGVSGTTIGEYSIYPVDGNSLLSLIPKYMMDIRDADKIYIEYGANDVTAIMCGFATMQTVVISFVKAIDWIRQINKTAEIIFLKFGSEKAIKMNSENMCHYLRKVYFSAFNFKFSSKLYAELYKELIDNVKKVCNNVKSMFTDNMVDNMSNYISDDKIHPNRDGHKLIARNIM